MNPKLLKSKRGDLKNISKIYIKEFSKPPYNEDWTLKKAISKMKFFYKFYDLYTIKIKKKIVGFIVINPIFMCPGEVAFIEEIAIKEEYQNQGIGTKIIKKISEIYKQRGFKKIMGIAVIKGRAINIYKKLKILPSKKDVLIEKKLK